MVPLFGRSHAVLNEAGALQDNARLPQNLPPPPFGPSDGHQESNPSCVGPAKGGEGLFPEGATGSGRYRQAGNRHTELNPEGPDQEKRKIKLDKSRC